VFIRRFWGTLRLASVCQRTHARPRGVRWRTDTASTGRHAAVLRLNATRRRPEPVMLYYSAVFLVMALIAAVFGFGGISAGAAGSAQLLFIVFFVSALLTFLFGWFRRR
jgi:uncharacterized membrane protein YtjA (UPF0391 family)